MPVRRSPGSAGASASYARVLPPQAPELKLSAAAVAQVERADPVPAGVRPVEESAVHAGLLSALARPLHLEPAVRRRVAREPHRTEAGTRALGRLEQLDVDLRGEHLVHATHETAAAQRLVVAVEEGALLGDAGRGRDDPVAEGRAATALVGLGLADDARHRRRIMGACPRASPAVDSWSAVRSSRRSSGRWSGRGRAT